MIMKITPRKSEVDTPYSREHFPKGLEVEMPMSLSIKEPWQLCVQYTRFKQLTQVSRLLKVGYNIAFFLP